MAEAEDETLADGLQTHVESYVSPTVQRLLDIFSRELSDEQRWAMELGHCLDEGIRRPDIYKFLDGGISYVEVPTRPDESYPLDSQVLSQRDWRTFQPGEKEPHSAWPHTLRQLLVSTNLKQKIDADIPWSWQSGAPPARKNTLRQLIDTLDQLIRQQLMSVNGRTIQRAGSSDQPTTAFGRIDVLSEKKPDARDQVLTPEDTPDDRKLMPEQQIADVLKDFPKSVRLGLLFRWAS